MGVQLKTIQELEKEAAEVEATINKLDAEDEKPEFERKMRFLADDFEQNPNAIWVGKNDLGKYGLEELQLGRLLLNARDEELPYELEEKFQRLADKARRYTLTTEDSGAGAELVPTEHWNQLFEDVRASSLVADLFRPFIPMSSKTVQLDELGDPIFYKPAGEGQAVTATDPATASRALTACLVKAQVDVSDELSEDNIVNSLVTLRQKFRLAAAETIDSVVLNADTTGSTSNINKYGAAVAGNEAYLLGFDGLIHYCQVEVTGQKSNLGTLDVTDFATLIGLLGKYADTPDQCAFIIDRGVKNKAIQLDDFRTKDKLGDKATLLTGQIGAVYGIPAIMSSQIAKSDANGRVDGATPGNNTLGRIVLVNRRMWKIGMRRSIRVAAERNESKGLTSLVGTMRVALQCLGDRSSSDYCHTALGYNVTI